MDLEIKQTHQLQHLNQGAVAIEQERAIAEAQGQIIMAKRFPRDLQAVFAELMTACKLPSLANVAFYAVPNRGSGPSIRLAEEIARCCGNIEWGHRELSRSGEKSEIEVYAWDKQTNTRRIRQLTVMHTQDTKDGPRKLKSEADIDNMITNKASKQVRGCLLAILPKWLVEDAKNECKKTLEGNNDTPIEVRVRAMIQAFSKSGVTQAHLEAYVNCSLDSIMIDQLVELTAVYNSIKDGAKPSDYFKVEKEESLALKNLNAAKKIEEPKVEAKKILVKENPKTKEFVKLEEPKIEPKTETKTEVEEPQAEQNESEFF